MKLYSIILLFFVPQFSNSVHENINVDEEFIIFMFINTDVGKWENSFKMMHHTNLENICKNAISATLFYTYGQKSKFINWLNNIARSKDEIQPHYEICDINIRSLDKRNQNTIIPALSCRYMNQQNILLARNTKYPAFIMFEKKLDSQYAEQIALFLTGWYVYASDSNIKKVEEILKEKTDIPDNEIESDFFKLPKASKYQFCASLIVMLQKTGRITLNEEADRYLKAHLNFIKFPQFNTDTKVLYCSTKTERSNLNVAVIPHPTNRLSLFAIYQIDNYELVLQLFVPTLINKY